MLEKYPIIVILPKNNFTMIKFHAVSKRFSEQYVLNDFSFEINQGDKVNVSGRSGIGKTTLFRLIFGFEHVDGGQIFYKEKPLTDKLLHELRRELAYVSQDLNIGVGNVRRFFEETLSLKANIAQKANVLQCLNELLAFFELSEALLDKNIEDLSGGEKQRVAIVNALLLQRKVFLLDEVTSALDKSLKEKVLNFFLKNEDYTVIYISHDNYLPEGVSVKTIKL